MNVPHEVLNSGDLAGDETHVSAGPFALECLHAILSELGSCSLLCAPELSPQNKTESCDHGSHRTDLVLSIQHPGESV